jgi:hypothetical protein
MDSCFRRNNKELGKIAHGVSSGLGTSPFDLLVIYKDAEIE